MIGRSLGGVLLACLFASAAVHAQDPSYEPRAPEFVGPLLPPGHWAVEATRRLDLLGAFQHHLPAQRALPLEEVERAFREAAGHERPRVAALAAAYHRRLLAEFSGLSRVTEDGGIRLLGLRTGVALDGRRGAAAPGMGEIEPHRTGAQPLADRVEPLIDAGISGAWDSRVTFAASPRAGPGGLELATGEVSLIAGQWAPSAGRIPVGYGHGSSGAATLHGRAPLNVIQLETRTPLLLPGALRYLGLVSGHTFFTKMVEERHPGNPYFWGGSGQLRPHRRVTLGVHRAVLFGGTNPEEQKVTFGKVVDMLVGRVAGVGFEDQVVSVSARLILPTESLIPLTAYLEWGAEDAAGAWRDVPGQVFGIVTPGLPGRPEVSMGMELSRFGASCCGNPEWYRHWSFYGSWASGDQTLAHQLGGHGSELSVFGGADLLEGGLRMKGRSYARRRGVENLFAPERAGGSLGAAIGIEWLPRASSALRLEWGRESGRGWTEDVASLGWRYHF